MSLRCLLWLFFLSSLASSAAHGRITPPEGAELASIKLNNKDETEVAVFISDKVKKRQVEHAFIIVHGKLRDGDYYWETMNKVVKRAKEANYPGSNRESIIIAPQLFSTVFNSGQYTSQQLAWGDLNAWQAGSVATHPSGTNFSSMDALDALLGDVSDRSKYPSMKNVTIVGHGGGGQLVQRYAAVGKDPSAHISVRYIHGDASSCAYFTTDRPITEDEDTTPGACEFYNTWRYGFDQFPGTIDGRKSPKEYFEKYITRDVISIVGYRDVKRNGDTSCMARAQGGTKRRDRNLVWYRYINTLARTSKNLDGFPGRFGNLPDWSSVSNGSVSLRLSVVEDADHDVAEVLQSKNGLSALFSDEDVYAGWRPRS
ncbi:uncharacterized protein NECHADRAFT_75887 [Fusarium vanettenii 77-13-4]|uniref:AB hydrolase-1 domain-containing protein n=1 Tax=Fusarium vanettenii (strain ATCC MYA-4622 / CBS 123669 / FGSC 9596 / NRRL 45880 / 77-13-4) TaxID=660122 RepID=C7Z5V9_FUSV7|nr:uncharacterized protein NECHADRAFT_75887 [Fusarium vanettenii 77-13-4]EEU40019.1 hypothetical protein NECHADRAFT_75887 [Fusarium vanettenii 77-13-4]